MPASALLDDARTLWQLAVARVRGATHAERLESFYADQARGYDQFRARMLHGRQELVDSIDPPKDAVWVDFGAGTGQNAEFLSPRLSKLSALYLVDLCPSLLAVAEERVTRREWQNVWVVCADATSFEPPEVFADVVTFSYSLTMIPDWFLAIDHALSLLKPGGIIGVVDFYVSRKYPAEGRRKHRWPTRSLWPIWFAADNINLNADHLPMLSSRFETQNLVERSGSVPYLPLVRVPYYRYVGRKSLAGGG
jgi:S-adenosylmethionine-diacylgycerolhomoserine-N-methlytransferase